MQLKYDTYISVSADIGGGLWIPHMGGIIINCRSMGKNCSVTKGVVIGNNASQDNIATIGDNCYFTLGCNVIVAQNAVVTKDVESNTVVGGIPAKIKKKSII